MEEEQTSVVELQPTETVHEMDVDSEISIEQPVTTPEAADPPASGLEPPAEVESEKQLRLLVTVLTTRLLTKCHALKNRSQEEWVAHTKRLVDQTLDGLTLTNNVCPDIKTTKKVCKVVLKELEKKFCGRQMLETVILLQDPAVDQVIVQSLQAHIKKLSARLARTSAFPRWWSAMLGTLAFSGIVLSAIILLLIIP